MLANDNTTNGDNPGYEVRDTNVRSVVNFVVALTLLLVVAQVALWVMLKAMTGGIPETRTALSMPVMADDEYRKLRVREDEILSAGTRVDKEAGKVRISVARAIDLLTERGLPATGTGKTESLMNSHSGIAAPAEPAGGLKK